jgi:hypothetical protein
MDTQAYQNAVIELYEAMNEMFLANNRLYAAAHVVWNWEANEMPSAILEELNHTGGEVVEEETMHKSWERTIDAWLDSRAVSAPVPPTAPQEDVVMDDSFFNIDA